MTFRLILGTVAIAVALSGSAYAASTKMTPKPAPKMTSAQVCTSLEAQYDAILPKHMKAKFLAAAKAHETKGIADCKAKKYVAAKWQLRRAVLDLGVKPNA
jgi:hypothetical protein